MAELEAHRTLVKSPPELWAEVSDATSLARHLGEVGEIRITRLEPETTVAWEGERASGTVEIAPAGWGTRVTLTADPIAAEPGSAKAEASAETESAPEPAPEPAAAAPGPAPATAEPTTTEPAAEVAPAPRPTGRLAALLLRLRRAPAATPAPVEPEPAPAVEPEGPPSAATAEAPAVEPEGPPSAAAAEAPADAGPTHDDVQADDAEPPADQLQNALTAALDSLGSAHHRPFSRG